MFKDEISKRRGDAGRSAEPKFYFGTDPRWLDVIRVWASGKPQIKTLWVHGSRATGRRRRKAHPAGVPDLDIAFELDGIEDGVLLGAAICLGPRWRIELNDLIPIEVDIQFADRQDPSRAAFIHRIQRHGAIIYRSV